MGEYTLDNLNISEKARVKRLCLNSGMEKRLRDFGFSYDTLIQCVGESILKDPKAFLIKGAVVALRRKDCQGIEVKKL